MRLNLYFSFIAFALLILPQKIIGQDHHELLSKQDLDLEITERHETPALSSLPEDSNPWQSYNQWMCFEKNAVELTTTEIVYDGQKKIMPQLNVTFAGQFFEISLSADTNYDNNLIFSDWKNLLSASGDVCIYAAFLPTINSELTSLWVIAELKTNNGYWIEKYLQRL